MLNLLFCIILASAVINGFALGGSMVWSLLAALIALVLLGMRLLFSRKLPVAIVNSVSAAGVVVLLLLGLWSGMSHPAAGFFTHAEAIGEIQDTVQDGDGFKAAALLDQLEKDYGANDILQILRAQAAIKRQDYTAARDSLDRVANMQSEDYFKTNGQLLLLKNDYNGVEDNFIAAAKAYPLWTDAQKIAGIQAVNNKHYSKAEYFLLRANEQAAGDPLPLYYLGVIRFEQGNNTEAEKFFEEALALGLDDEQASYVAWYRQQMGGEVE